MKGKYSRLLAVQTLSSCKEDGIVWEDGGGSIKIRVDWKEGKCGD